MIKEKHSGQDQGVFQMGNLKAIFNSSIQNIKDSIFDAVFYMVPGEGVEPSIPYGRGILSPQRIPVPPPRLSSDHFLIRSRQLDFQPVARLFENVFLSRSRLTSLCSAQV